MFDTFLKHLPIQRRVIGAFGALGTLAVIAFGVIWLEVSNLRGQIGELKDNAEISQLSGELNADMAKLQLNAREYLASRKQEDRDSIERFEKEVSEGIEKLDVMLKDGEMSEIVDEKKAAFDPYQRGVDDLVAMMGRRDVMVKRMGELAVPMRQALSVRRQNI